ncbi:MAG: putative bifunctional diguanylate cyclase/phosphodiesterase [Oxalobacteraceae bacterium]
MGRSEACLRLVIDHLAEGLMVVSADGTHLHWNKAALEIFGYLQSMPTSCTQAEIMADYDILSPDGQLLSREAWPLPRLLRGERLRNVEVILRHVRQRWTKEVSFGGTLVRDDAGHPLMAVLTIRHVTARRRAERARARAKRRQQLAIGIARLGSWEWNLADGSIYLSPQWKHLLGYAGHELPNRMQAWEERMHPADRERTLSALNGFVQAPQGTFQSEYRMQHRDGDYRWVSSQAVADCDDSGKVRSLIGTMIDITRQKLEAQRVREAAQHCALTGLPNRALIFEYANHLLAAASRQHSRGALLFIDLDRFKPVNDLYGHDIGDRLLEQVARRMVACVRQEDLVGRLGGDEFVIVLPYMGKGHSAPTVARHVIAALSQPFRISGLELSISASVGISFYPLHGADIDALLHRADLAMYRAKAIGRGNYQVHTPELGHRRNASASIETQLRLGLAENLFVLHYQPVIHVDDGRVACVEALLRLPVTNDNPLAPAAFIPVAESVGLIAQLGDWVTQAVCRQFIEWRDQGVPPIRMAMNISTLQFRQRGFVARLLNIVRQHGVDPGYLQIEVTESALVERTSDAMEALAELDAAGMNIALDDLGTVGCSLDLITHLPLDTLKVDQIFVSKLEHDQASRAVADTIIAMGKAMDLNIVGEGVDTDQTLAYLRSRGCRQVQGNLLGAPMPAYDFLQWYLGRSPSKPTTRSH